LANLLHAGRNYPGKIESVQSRKEQVAKESKKRKETPFESWVANTTAKKG